MKEALSYVKSSFSWKIYVTSVSCYEIITSLNFESLEDVSLLLFFLLSEVLCVYFFFFNSRMCTDKVWLVED